MPASKEKSQGSRMNHSGKETSIINEERGIWKLNSAQHVSPKQESGDPQCRIDFMKSGTSCVAFSTSGQPVVKDMIS